MRQSVASPVADRVVAYDRISSSDFSSKIRSRQQWFGIRTRIFGKFMILREKISLRNRASIELESLMIRPRERVCVCV
jgi:hypothetical protein